MESWSGFFATIAGAAASLTGMLVVAISINLNRILGIPHLPDRAASAVIPLAGVLIVAIFALAPAQSRAAFGAETLGCGLLTWALTGLMLIRSLPGRADAPKLWRWSHLLLGQGQTLPFVIAGGLLVAGRPAGLYWILAGVVAAFLGAIMNTWVLLIEILR